ncbi:hypothetical protein [Nannocystis pusilla]
MNLEAGVENVNLTPWTCKLHIVGTVVEPGRRSPCPHSPRWRAERP